MRRLLALVPTATAALTLKTKSAALLGDQNEHRINIHEGQHDQHGARNSESKNNKVRMDHQTSTSSHDTEGSYHEFNFANTPSGSMEYTSGRNINDDSLDYGTNSCLFPTRTEEPPWKLTTKEHLLVGWAVGGYLLVHLVAITRVIFIIIDNIQKSFVGNRGTHTEEMNVVDWLLLATCITIFSYLQGYLAFQRNFNPRLIARAFALTIAPWYCQVLAPFFSMGLFALSTRKRVLLTWMFILMIALWLWGAEYLPVHWRISIDAGVASGLIWGACSMLVIYSRSALNGSLPTFDPDLSSRLAGKWGREMVFRTNSDFGTVSSRQSKRSIMSSSTMSSDGVINY
eukprot:gene691-736_t